MEKRAKHEKEEEDLEEEEIDEASSSPGQLRFAGDEVGSK
jgi:hypothetical protein